MGMCDHGHGCVLLCACGQLGQLILCIYDCTSGHVLACACVVYLHHCFGMRVIVGLRLCVLLFLVSML